MFNASHLILILGAGKTGTAVADWLKERKIPYAIWDEKQGSTPDIDWEKTTHVVQSPGVSPNHVIAQEANLRQIPILTDIDIFRRVHKKSNIIGITGTNGKSTTTALITHMLKYSGLSVAMGGNIGTPVLSLPSIYDWEGYYVLELSSYQLELSKDLNLMTAAWLNISEDHLERHGTMEKYVAAKKRIFNGAKNAVICIDDPYSKDVYQSLKGQMNMITVSLKGDADIAVVNNVLYAYKEKVVELKDCLSMYGAHNHQNAAVACAVGKTLNIPNNNIAYALMTFPGLAHRQQAVGTIGHLVIVNDSKATNADATEKALQTYQDHEIYWILGGRAKTDGITPLISYFKNIRHAFVFGEAQDDFNTLLERHDVLSVKCYNLETATAAAVAFARKEYYETKKQVILFSPACASFDQFKNFEERGDFFCKTVRELLDE